MKWRVAWFVAAWVAAFALLPTAWVAGAFALWQSWQPWALPK